MLATTDYIAPEQALGEPVSPRSDLYSLGVVLFEMLTGDVPFHGESAVAVAMKHVREQLPDVQRLRPGISAATAAVIERACAKDPAQRYPDAESMAADLEQALALEASRSGQATGEVTSVLRTLPGEAQRKVPWTVRHRLAWGLSLGLLLLVGVAVALLTAFARTHRGAGVPAASTAGSGLHEVSLAQAAAHGYNPFGTGPENRDQVGNLVDNDPNTTWSTERYYSGTLHKAGGVGTGVYLDAAPGVAAKAIAIHTPTPGFPLQVYAANHLNLSYPYGDSTPLSARGWHGPVGSTEHVVERPARAAQARRVALPLLPAVAHRPTPRPAVGEHLRDGALQVGARGPWRLSGAAPAGAGGARRRAGRGGRPAAGRGSRRRRSASRRRSWG